MTTEIQILPAEVIELSKGVSTEKRNEVQTVLNQVFNGVNKMREQLDSVNVSDVDDKLNMKLANAIRLGVRQVRLEAEKTFDAKRAEVQEMKRSFDTEDKLWLKAKQTMQILTKEIEENARWKEETKERFLKEEKELKIQQRIVSISKFNPEIQRNEFENMSDETFETFLNGIETAFNARIEAEKAAESARLEADRLEAERIEAQRIENEKLKSDAIERDRLAKIEAEKLAKERAENEAKLKAIQEEADKKAREERAKLEAIEAELQAKKDAELKAIAENNARILAEQKAAAKAAKAPKQEKLTNWVTGFEIVAPQGLESETVVSDILQKFEAFKNWAKNEIKLT